jgi:hypothetical protein
MPVARALPSVLALILNSIRNPAPPLDQPHRRVEDTEQHLVGARSLLGPTISVYDLLRRTCVDHQPNEQRKNAAKNHDGSISIPECAAVLSHGAQQYHLIVALATGPQP